MLETAPSFSIYSNNTVSGEEERENGLRDEDGNTMVKSVTTEGNNIGGKILGSGDFSFMKPNMDLIKEDEVGDEVEEAIGDGLDKLEVQEVVEPASPPMYLAAGLGIRNGGEGFGLERENSEEYYRQLIEEYPNHPLVLKNYAHLLLSKGDLEGAEYYYFRATEANPRDGEVMSQYAKLVWELHGDRVKALKYFELAVQIAPEDSNVLAANAKFLWEIDDDGEEITTLPDHIQEDRQHPADGLDSGNTGCVFGAGGANEGDVIVNYYKRMIEENPSDPLFLKNYAQFLYQSKGDLQVAEEYYSRAIMADPQDGKILSQYAKLVWEQHHDQDKALIYFERAIEAAPGDRYETPFPMLN